MTTYGAIASAAREVGLEPRGGFRPQPADGLPPAAATVVLVGNIGGSLWPSFSASPEFADGAADPLDRWTVRVATRLATELGATPLYPFGGPPHWPFQRWAQRAQDVHTSPLGLLIHPEYGLWHAYRAALLFADTIDLPARYERTSPCATCAAKPCLSACPVSAFTGTNYNVAACAKHLAAPAGKDCMDQGCRARRECPIGREHYPPAQSRFHMTAFRRAHPPE